MIRVFKEMGNLLEIAEENSFEIMAYQRGARSLEAWEGDLEVAVEDGSLTSLEAPGLSGSTSSHGRDAMSSPT